ncbi:replicative DNA helicase [Caballeronia sp. LjRoot31]|uniref:replicative DNA helicase n=1 Tax=Caballeronia sp. LjRoot31 TaxID=3342324 RepID=UPI003ECF118C
MGAKDPVETRGPIVAIEAEQSVLGGLLLNNDGLDAISGVVTADDFTTDEHRLIFIAITELIASGRVADPITVFERLHVTGARLKEPLRYLNELSQNTPSAANIRHYATIVRNRSISRELLRVASEIIESVHKPAGRDPGELLDDAQSRLLKLAEGARQDEEEFRPISEALTRVVENIDDRYQNGGDDKIGGVATGFIDLDRAMDGMHPGELIVVGGRPSMGKTAFALNIGEHVAAKLGLPVAVISIEMPADQLAQRLLSSNSRINQHKLRTANLRDDDWPRLTHGVQSLVDVPIYTLDVSALTPLRMKAKVRRLRRTLKRPLGLVIVDYLQLMSGDGSGDNRAIEISEISRALKVLAKDLKVPVMALSQLNRGVEQRPNKRPVMSDIRESGSIEQDADVILFIYRDEVYNPDSQDKGCAEIIIAKQRNGSLGTHRLAFQSALTRFENYASDQGFQSA